MKDIWKVLLVDDDGLILDDLRHSIDWPSIGFQVCGLAHNGKRAFDMITKLRPHLVITDIVMPIMDGLTLVAQIRDSFPDIQILIISAYDEFQYAKRAIQSGVADYILKTEVGMPSFVSKLTQIHAKIDHYYQNMKRTQLFEVNAFFQPDEMTFLNQYERSGYSVRQMPPGVEGNYFFLVLTERHHFRKNYEYPGFASFDSIYQRYLQLSDIISDDYAFEFLIRYSDLEILAFRPDSDMYIPGSAWIELCRNLIEFCCCEEKAGYIALYRQKPCSLGKIKEELERCYGKILFLSTFSDAEIHKLEDAAPGRFAIPEHIPSFPVLTSVNDISDLQPAITVHRQYLESLFYACDYPRLEQYYRSFYQHYKTIVPGIDEILSDFFCPASSSFESVSEWLVSCLEQIVDVRKQIENGKLSPTIRQTIRFIRDHYDNPDLSISQLADFVQTSPSHLAHIFKRETGKTMNDYITDVRMQTAKHMLQHTNRTISEIAEHVGYRSSQYFSQVYYKKNGVNPKDDRRIKEY